ncbi:MAG: hypothetical protein R2785_03805 [Flavobacteriaceae bacterium]
MSDNFKHTKQTGFKVPEGYFNHLEDTVLNKLNESSKLETIKNSGFNVPQDYFSKVENSVFKAIKKEEKEVKVVSLWSRKNILYASGVAAAVVLMISIFNKDKKLTFDSLDTELVELYITPNNINTSDLATLWNEAELSDVAIDSYGFLDETVEDYILENSSLEDLLID